MRCPICGSDYDGPHCPNCVTHLPAGPAQAQQNADSTRPSPAADSTGTAPVVDVEIVHDGQQTGGQSGFHSAGWRSGNARSFTWTSWKASGGNGGSGTGGMPGFGSFGGMQGQYAGLSFWITLGLMLACGMQYGFLAAIGFLFFYVIGAALGMFFTVSHLLNGRVINPWLIRGCNWTACWLLTAWLAR